MAHVKIFGQPTAVYEYLKTSLLEEAEKAGIELDLEEIKDVKQFIAHGIESIPTVEINNELRLQLAVKTIHHLICEARLALLRAENYGNMKQLIVPVDFSETSDNAYEYALSLVPIFEGMIRLVHFYHPVATDVEGEVYLNAELEDVHRTQLEDFVPRHEKSKNLQRELPMIEKDFRIGFPATGIPAMSKEIGNGLIVMGSTGQGGAFKKIFGSVSIDAAKKSEMPVLIIPPETSYSAVKRIAYATNNMRRDGAVVDELIALANAFQAELFLVHVMSEDDPFSSYEALDLWDHSYDPEKVSYFTLEGDDVVQAINDFVEKENVDWVAMATEQRGFFGDLFHRSTTKNMARLCKKPLLVLHKEDQ